MARCDQVQDRLPDFVGGRLDGSRAATEVETHLAGCAECRAVRDVVAALVAAPPPSVPAGLEARILEAVGGERRRRHPVKPEPRRTPLTWRPRRAPRRTLPRWALAAAAVVIAVATPQLVERLAPDADNDAQVAALLSEVLPSPWFGEEGMVAGAPLLDDLSDEALAQLLREME